MRPDFCTKNRSKLCIACSDMVRVFITDLKRERKNCKKEEPQLRGLRVEAPGLVEVTGFEPAASTSRT